MMAAFADTLCQLEQYDNIAIERRHDVITEAAYRTAETERLRRWNAVEDALAKDPSLARVRVQVGVGGAGEGETTEQRIVEEYPLFVACSRHRAPLSTIRSLVNAYPEALRCKDRMGQTILFRASYNLDHDAFHTLLNAAVTLCSIRDDQGRLPHHHAAMMDSSDLRNLWSLLKEYPRGARGANAASQREGGRTEEVRSYTTPLHDLCRYVFDEKYLLTIADRVSRNVTPVLPTDDFPRRISDSKAMGVPVHYVVLMWSKVQLLLMAAYHRRVPAHIPDGETILEMRDHITIDGGQLFSSLDDGDEGEEEEEEEGRGQGQGRRRSYSACHATAGCGAPVIVSNAVIQVHSHQVTEKDHLGRLPLHVAAARRNVARFFCDTCNSWKAEGNYRQMYEEDLFVHKLCLGCYRSAYKFAEGHGFGNDTPVRFPSSDDGNSRSSDEEEDSTTSTTTTRRLEEGRLFACSDIKDTFPAERKSTVETLLDSYPRGVDVRDDRGWLPIHHAAFGGDVDGCIRPLFMARPRSLEAKATAAGGATAGLNPFQLAVVRALKDADGGGNIDDVDIVYRMLLWNPGFVLQCSCEEGGRQEGQGGHRQEARVDKKPRL